MLSNRNQYGNPRIYLSLLLILLSILQTSLLYEGDIVILLMQGRVSQRAVAQYKIAQNLAEGKGFTFDGIHKTGSFSPMWILLMAFIFKIISNPMDSALMCWALSELIFHAALIILFILSSKRLKCLSDYIALIAFFALFPGVKFAFIDGLESSLAFLYVSALFLIFDNLLTNREFKANTKRGVGLGILLTLGFYIRPDLLIFGAILFMVLVFQKINFSSGLKKLTLGALVSSSVLIIPYFIYNKIALDSVSPIFFSGASSLSRPEIFSNIFLQMTTALNLHLGPSVSSIITILMVVGFLVLALWSLFKKRAFLCAISFAISFRILSFILIGRKATLSVEGISSIDILVFIILVIYAFIILFKTVFGKKYGSLIFVLILTAFSTLMTFMKDVNSPVRDRNKVVQSFAAIWTSEYIPPNTIMASFEPEILALVSQRSVIDLSGKYNDKAYNKNYLSRDNVAEYIIDENVDYIFGRFEFIKPDSNSTLVILESGLSEGEASAEYKLITKLSENLRIKKQFSHSFYIIQFLKEG
ncbi:hypothetical protein KAH81_04020 [bacterium]|nr:hypothetical protein [bacterium]